MYFPITAAKQVATTPALPNIPSESVVALSTSPAQGTLLHSHPVCCCCVVWQGKMVEIKAKLCQLTSVQPSALLSILTRTPTSILNHGDNIDAWWSPDGSRIVVKVIHNRWSRCVRGIMLAQIRHPNHTWF